MLLNLNNESYYGLDEVGTRMWELLTSSESIQAAYDQLLDEYEVEAETLRRDMQNLISNLFDQGLLEISVEQSS